MFLWHRNSLPWQATVQSANLPLSRMVEMSVERRLTDSTPFPPFSRQFRALKHKNMRCSWRGGSSAHTCPYLVVPQVTKLSPEMEISQRMVSVSLGSRCSWGCRSSVWDTNLGTGKSRSAKKGDRLT